MSILSVTDTIIRPSLLPYLQIGSGRFYLMISLESASELSPLEPFHNPFQFKEVSDPFSLLGKAYIASDLGVQLLPLHMLVQRSDYPCSFENRHLYTNLSIDQRWRQIMSVLAATPLNNTQFLLTEQIGKQGELLKFRSLFYCRTKQSFFHPVCPDCGKEIELCTDDTLLSQNGLEGYSTSLRRYLYCPQCCSDKTCKYYVIKRKENDPECVGDLQQLIRNWAQLQAASAPDTSLPCYACPGNKACYGPNNFAVNTLCSFSFYPFYMLLLKAESNVNFDFQELLSGKEQTLECIVRKDIQTDHESLLQSTKLVTPEPPLKGNDSNNIASIDAAIRAILDDIAAKWENEEEEKKQPPLAKNVSQSSHMTIAEKREPVDLMETVILSSTSMSPIRMQNIDRRGAGGVDHNDGTLGPDREPPLSSQFNSADVIQQKRTMQEDQKANKKSFNHLTTNRCEQQLRETIIIPRPPGQVIRSYPNPSPLSEDTSFKTTNNQQTPAAHEKKIDVDLAETLIQRPGKKT